MNEDIINGIITAIGSIAEISATYYKTLVRKGLPEEVALKLSIAFVSTFTEVSFGRIHDDDDEGE